VATTTDAATVRVDREEILEAATALEAIGDAIAEFSGRVTTPLAEFAQARAYGLCRAAFPGARASDG
jgi:hypothetical protein